MAIRIDAYVLLSRAWKPDYEAIASEIEWRYPQIGKARVKRGSAGPSQATLVVDGAPVEMSYVSAPYPADQLHPPMRTIGHDPDAVDRLTLGQSSYVMISAVSPASGLDWARALAALATLVASAVAGRTESIAILWPDSWACLAPAAFEDAAGAILRGEAPLSVWCAFAHSNPARVGGADMTGVASLGLRTYVGRELELAPTVATPREAERGIEEAARRLISGKWAPEDNEALSLDSFKQPLSVRIADDGFLRTGVPAVVLVAPDAAIDAVTLTRKRGVGKVAGAGLFGQLFRRG